VSIFIISSLYSPQRAANNISFHAIILKVALSEPAKPAQKKEFNAKWPFRVIQGHAFWDR